MSSVKGPKSIVFFYKVDRFLVRTCTFLAFINAEDPGEFNVYCQPIQEYILMNETMDLSG